MVIIGNSDELTKGGMGANLHMSFQKTDLGPIDVIFMKSYEAARLSEDKFYKCKNQVFEKTTKAIVVWIR